MSIRFVTKQIHAYLDYPVAIALMVLPFVLGLGTSDPMALWLSVMAGAAAFVLTLITDHQTGFVPVVPYRLHEFVDLIVGLSFLAAPIVLGFHGIDALFYWANGAAVVTVVALSKPETADAAAA
ncbi:MAG: hypothetical protein AAGE80_13095 [Pseudomonadota bacterium]